MKRSNSFINLRSKSQAILDFSVLVCTAVPQLKHAFDEHDNDPSTFLATNSNFRESNEPYSTEKRTMTAYKKIQGANLLISNFSFFESYFFALIDEMVEFHGGELEYLAFIRRKLNKEPILSEQDARLLNRLRKPHDSRKADRFRSATSSLSDKKIIWPSEKLAFYGLSQIFENKKRWKSAQIPTLSDSLLMMSFTQDEHDRFHTLRNDRNQIAHGSKLRYDLDKAVDANHFLYCLAKRIDEHCLKNYFVIEKYS